MLFTAAHARATALWVSDMALDTIMYALERHSMEQERSRLETRLQQARNGGHVQQWHCP
jgi:hypothetical protein